MTLREKILKTFIVTIREVNTHGGVDEFFKKYPVGGFFYSEDKPLLDERGKEMGSATLPQTWEKIKRVAEDILFCADWAYIDGQEVKMLPQRSLGGSGNLSDAYAYGKVLGMQMNAKGIDWVLLPSIDMCMDHLMYLTAISDDPEMIGKIYREVIRGIEDQGVAACAKHFPGLGTYFVNMHIAPGSNVLSFPEWMETYGYTYKEMIKENVMAVMTTHVSLKSYDAEGSDGYYPTATFSKKLTTNLLKEELGFSGVVVTDALIMGGMATGDLVAETVQAFKAGADMLLWPPVEAAEAIEKAILSGEIPMSRLEDALARIGKMKDFRKKALDEKSYDTPDAHFADETMLSIAKHGMCLLRNDLGILPLGKETKKILVVDVTDEDNFSSGLLKEELEKRGFSVDVKRDIYDVPSRVCWQSDIDKLQGEYDMVIFNVNAFFVAEWSVPHMLIWASHLFKKEKKIIVNYGAPFFATDYFPEDPTFIEMNCPPNAHTIKLLVDGLLGEMEFTGKSLLKEYRK